MQGWLGLHLVNTGAVSKLAVSLDSHSMFVYAADGLFTAIQEVKASFTSLQLMGRADFFPGILNTANTLATPLNPRPIGLEGTAAGPVRAAQGSFYMMLLAGLASFATRNVVYG